MLRRGILCLTVSLTPFLLTSRVAHAETNRVRIPANLIAYSGDSDHLIGAERRCSDSCLYLRA